MAAPLLFNYNKKVSYKIKKITKKPKTCNKKCEYNQILTKTSLKTFFYDFTPLPGGDIEIISLSIKGFSGCGIG